MDSDFNYFHPITDSAHLLVNSQREHPLPVGTMLNLQRMCSVSPIWLEGSDQNFRCKVKLSLHVEPQKRSPWHSCYQWCMGTVKWPLPYLQHGPPVVSAKD